MSIQYNPIGVPAVILYTQARLDGPQTPAGADTAAAGLAARGPGPAEALLGEIEISSDGRVNAFDAAAAGGRTPTFSAPVTLGAYHALAIRADFGADSYQFFVDGSPLGTPVPFDPRLTSGVIGEAELVAHARGTAAERGAYTSPAPRLLPLQLSPRTQRGRP